MIGQTPSSSLFPYTTLFRSRLPRADGLLRCALRCGQARNAKARDHSPHCRSEEHTSELQSLRQLVCRLLLEKKNKSYDKEYALEHKAGRRPWEIISPIQEEK